MKFIKLIGLFSLIAITFFYTEKVINVTINQDEIMIKIKEYANSNDTKPQNAITTKDTIIPGSVGKYIDIESSYKAMKKIGYFEPSLLTYKEIYPEISIYNNYNKYILKGNTKEKNISLIYIVTNNNLIDNVLKNLSSYDTPINFFIDSNFLNNNIILTEKLKNYEIYNYGNQGTYTKDNLIITNNIINNKAKNESTFCLFLKKNIDSLNNCANTKMLSLLLDNNNNYLSIKNNLENGNIYLIDSSKELPNIIEYITSKGYKIVPLSVLIKE